MAPFFLSPVNGVWMSKSTSGKSARQAGISCSRGGGESYVVLRPLSLASITDNRKRGNDNNRLSRGHTDDSTAQPSTA